MVSSSPNVQYKQHNKTCRKKTNCTYNSLSFVHLKVQTISWLIVKKLVLNVTFRCTVTADSDLYSWILQINIYISTIYGPDLQPELQLQPWICAFTMKIFLVTTCIAVESIWLILLLLYFNFKVHFFNATVIRNCYDSAKVLFEEANTWWNMTSNKCVLVHEGAVYRKKQTK